MIDYIGEHAFVGELGETLLIVAVVSALLSMVSYLLANNTGEAAYNRLARAAFTVHSLALIGSALTLFMMLFNQYFEYDYVWTHANKEMPMRYIFSCFWEGKEGSFFLWSFWNVVLGNVLFRTARSWENMTMVVVTMMQVFLGAMILGVYIFDMKIGTNPFTLIRELPENIGLPWTTMPDYLSRIPTFENGRGLNPLLQNYWMTIHPPTLFLGYASTVVPFAFVVAGLWRGQLQAWIKPAIPWAFFSVSVLGIGILMGGAWAYEALSFGGFWAWDPVENASLIPWLTMVGAAHVMMVNQKKNKSVYTTIFLTLITYILVMYASFLVHSGVLGDTSVHAFTGEGSKVQHMVMLFTLVALSTTLLLFNKQFKLIYLGASLFLLIVGLAFEMEVAAVVTFLGTSVAMIVAAYFKFFPRPKQEEPLWSREFWMFLGALVLLLSGLQISLETSKPIWNILAEPFAEPLMGLYDLTGIDGFKSLAESKLAPHSNVIDHFNKWQLPFAFIVTFLIGMGQFLRYGKNNFKKFAIRLSQSLVVSLILAFVFGKMLDYSGEDFLFGILLFTTIFAVVGNLDFLIRTLKGKFNFAGGTVAHIGFALVMLGALISTSRSDKISENGSRFDIEQLNENFKNNEDILLFINDTVPMGPYFVAYTGNEKEGVNIYYEVDYYDQVQRQYKQGDLTIARGAIFRALEDHAPGPDFIMDQTEWELVQDPTGINIDEVKRWSQYKPGKHLFTLHPRIQLNPQFGNVAEPATKRYLTHDIYTHVRWAELEIVADDNGFREAIEVKLAVGDTAFIGTTKIRLNGLSIVKDEEREQYMIAPNDLAVRAMIGVKDDKDNVFEAEPLYILRDSVLPVPDPVIQDETGLRFNFKTIDPVEGKHTFTVAEHIDNRKEFIVLQAIQFPMINILWLGCLIMFFGTMMAVRHRIKLSKKGKKK